MRPVLATYRRGEARGRGTSQGRQGQLAQAVLGWLDANKQWMEAVEVATDSKELEKLERDIERLKQRLDWAIQQDEIRRGWDQAVDKELAELAKGRKS